MKRYLFIQLITVAVFFMATSFQTAFTRKWIILEDCSVKVNGTTNVNKFTCRIPEYTKPDTITWHSDAPDMAAGMSGTLALPVLSFDCDNRMMTNDLRKTLKAKAYPTLFIRFISMERYPVLKSSQECITGMVSIELAGVAKNIKVNYRISRDAQQVIHLVGNQTMNFTDFRLTPPKRLAGMVKADDKLNVEFRINFKAVKE